MFGMSRPRRKPGVVASTRNIDSERAPAPGSVTHTTCTTSQKCAFVIQPLRPLMIQSPPSRLARQVMPSTSLPPRSSVFAKASDSSPRTSGAR